MLQTVDRLRLVNTLAREDSLAENPLDVTIQVNVSGEEQKSGVSPADAGALLAAVRDVPGLNPIGFMTMAPYGADEATLKSVFSGLRMLRDELQQSTGVALPMLSMGMSDDFPVAIAEGATHVRIGRALFGSR